MSLSILSCFFCVSISVFFVFLWYVFVCFFLFLSVFLSVCPPLRFRPPFRFRLSVSVPLCRVLVSLCVSLCPPFRFRLRLSLRVVCFGFYLSSPSVSVRPLFPSLYLLFFFCVFISVFCMFFKCVLCVCLCGHTLLHFKIGCKFTTFF